MPSKPAPLAGRYLRSKRTAAGLSLRDVADAMSPKMSHVALAEVERGVRTGLKKERWPELERVITGFSAAEFERLLLESRPFQLSLDGAPKQYVDLGLALARRIERRDLQPDDVQEILRILGREGEDFDA